MTDRDDRPKVLEQKSCIEELNAKMYIEIALKWELPPVHFFFILTLWIPL